VTPRAVFDKDLSVNPARATRVELRLNHEDLSL